MPRASSGGSWEMRTGTFRLSTLFRGRRMCLDIFNGGPIEHRWGIFQFAALRDQHPGVCCTPMVCVHTDLV